MRKYLRSAIVIDVLALLAALTFLLAYLRFGLGHERPLLNVSLVLVGLVATALLLAVLWQRTLLREAIVRRFYISRDGIYNHEIGYAPLDRIVPDGDPYDFVTFAAEALATMSYGFEVADTPDSFEPFLLIESNVFLYHGAGDDPSDTDEGIVVDDWCGVLRAIDSSSRGKVGYRDIAAFDGAGELARLLDENGALGTPHQQEVVC